MMNPLKQLSSFGQSIWLDYIKRDLITTGQLKKLISEDNLRGITSNPNIFENAITKSHCYDDEIKRMSDKGDDVNTIYEALSQKDVQDAADEFRDLYNQMEGKDGYVSLEVNPHLANDTNGTIEEARRLWKSLNRPNVFIKVPATKAGLPAIQQLISEGININVTLLFGIPRYREVIQAYLAGIETRVAAGNSVKNVSSVASFFLSRIDVLIDPILEKFIEDNDEKSELAKRLQGQIAIYSAKNAYQIFTKEFHSDRFNKLAAKGARVQRLLWASTGTKNPNYSDIKYVESLIGPDTVNTLPLETLDAYRNHGDPKLRLLDDADNAELLLSRLSELNINLDDMTQQLEIEGVSKFSKAYDQLMTALKKSVLKV